MSLSLAKGICALCCVRTSNITMSVELTCPWTKMRRFLGQWPPMVALPSVPFSADYITNIAGFEFPTETGQRRRGTRIGEHLKLVLSIIDRGER